MQNTIKQNKKGISSTIAVVIMIVIGLAAFSILYLYVSSTVSNVNLSPVFSCYEMQANPPISIPKACYNQNTGEIETTLQRGIQDMQIDSLNFIINSDSSSSNWNCGECMSCKVLDQGSGKTYFFALTDASTQKTVSVYYNSCLLASKNIEPC